MSNTEAIGKLMNRIKASPALKAEAVSQMAEMETIAKLNRATGRANVVLSGSFQKKNKDTKQMETLAVMRAVGRNADEEKTTALMSVNDLIAEAKDAIGVDFRAKAQALIASRTFKDAEGRVFADCTSDVVRTYLAYAKSFSPTAEEARKEAKTQRAEEKAEAEAREAEAQRQRAEAEGV